MTLAKELVIQFDSTKTPGVAYQLVIKTVEDAVVVAAQDAAVADQLQSDLRDIAARVDMLRYRLKKLERERRTIE